MTPKLRAKNLGRYAKIQKTQDCLSVHLGTSLKEINNLFITNLMTEDSCVPVTERE